MMSFSRWMRKNHVENSALATAIREMESGLIDADLGGLLFKKRIPLAGMGKRGGAQRESERTGVMEAGLAHSGYHRLCTSWTWAAFAVTYCRSEGYGHRPAGVQHA